MSKRNENRWHTPSRLKSRPIPYENTPGNEEESQWFRCAVCGFPCKVGRDAESGYGSGNTTEEASITHWGTIHVSNISRSGIFRPYGIDIEPDVILSDFQYSALKAVVANGCPGCGSYNWRGTIRK